VRDRALDDGEVALAHFARCEQLRQLRRRGGVSREDDHAAGLRVDAVDEVDGAVADAHQLFERALLAIARRLRRDARRLVHRDPVRRLADHVQLRQRLGQGDAITLAHFPRRDADGPVVDEHTLARDQLARLAARDLRITCGDRLIETHGAARRC
jgi:hypothetical protein